MKKSFCVTKHNDLITSAYRLTLTEMQIVLYGISLINPIDNKFPRTYEINMSTFSKMFNKHIKNTYRDVKEAIMKRFWEREFTFKDKYETNKLGELVRARVKWVTTVKYSDKAGFIKIYFNPEIEDYLHNLKNNFTTYYVEMVSKFRRFYSVRFYEIAVMHLNRCKSNKCEFKISIEDIRDILDLGDKYQRFISFKTKVIIPSITEINQLSDIKLSFDVVKYGRKPTELKFSVTRESQPPVQLNEEVQETKDSTLEITKRVSPESIILAKDIALLANTGWDVYAIEDQFYNFMKSKGLPKDINKAFIGFVKKKVALPPR